MWANQEKANKKLFHEFFVFIPDKKLAFTPKALFEFLYHETLDSSINFMYFTYRRATVTSKENNSSCPSPSASIIAETYEASWLFLDDKIIK